MQIWSFSSIKFLALMSNFQLSTSNLSQQSPSMLYTISSKSITIHKPPQTPHTTVHQNYLPISLHRSFQPWVIERQREISSHWKPLKMVFPWLMRNSIWYQTFAPKKATRRSQAKTANTRRIFKHFYDFPSTGGKLLISASKITQKFRME